jgi:hypothetical protein
MQRERTHLVLGKALEVPRDAAGQEPRIHEIHALGKLLDVQLNHAFYVFASLDNRAPLHRLALVGEGQRYRVSRALIVALRTWAS